MLGSSAQLSSEASTNNSDCTTGLIQESTAPEIKPSSRFSVGERWEIGDPFVEALPTLGAEPCGQDKSGSILLGLVGRIKYRSIIQLSN